MWPGALPGMGWGRPPPRDDGNGGALERYPGALAGLCTVCAADGWAGHCASRVRTSYAVFELGGHPAADIALGGHRCSSSQIRGGQHADEDGTSWGFDVDLLCPVDASGRPFLPAVVPDVAAERQCWLAIESKSMTFPI